MKDSDIHLIVTALTNIKKMANHEIPHYAFVDNEAACDMDDRLISIHNYTCELLSAIEVLTKDNNG